MTHEITYAPRRAGKTEALASMIAMALANTGQWPHIAAGDGGRAEVDRIRSRAWEIYTQLAMYTRVAPASPWKEPVVVDEHIYEDDLPGYWKRTPSEHYLRAEALLEEADRETHGSSYEAAKLARAQVHATLASALLGEVTTPVVQRGDFHFEPTPRRVIEDVQLPAEPQDELGKRRGLHGQPDGV